MTEADSVLSKAERWLRIANVKKFDSLEQIDLHNAAEVIARKEYQKELQNYMKEEMKYAEAQEKLEKEISELLELKNAR